MIESVERSAVHVIVLVWQLDKCHDNAENTPLMR